MSTAAMARAASLSAAVLVASMCGASVAAQGPETSATGSDTPAGSISFMVFGDPAELAAYQGLVTAFESRHPDVDVELVHIPDQADYRQRLGLDFAAGTPADIVLINYRRYAPFVAQGALEPLGPYLDRSELVSEADFYSEALEPFRWQGELMCIPQNLSSLVVYYNQALFDAAGLPYPSDDWTWAEFLATAQSLTRDIDGDGRTDQFGLGTEASIFRVAPFIWQNGGELVTLSDRGLPVRLALDTPAAREAVQWFVDLQVTHHVVPNAEEEVAEDSESRFQNGRTAMFLNSRRGVPTYRQITGFDWDVAALPQQKRRAGILHSDAYCMPGVTANKDAAWQFIEFANSAEGQSIIARSGRTVPSLVEVSQSDAFLDPTAKPANSQVFLSSLSSIRAVPVIPGWVDVEELAGEELERAFYGNATVDEAIAAAITSTRPFFGSGE
jgi:multiple sugar transport system substrate-binding protein